jgi:type I restriction enzyme M protein
LFYNTGIATYIWVLTNRKPEHRRGKVQLIDGTEWFKPLRKNLGQKNCELSPDDIRRICETYLAFQETEQSKIFPNATFGYWKVRVERPLRLHSQFTRQAIESLRFVSGDEEIRSKLYDRIGEALFENFESVELQLGKILDEWDTDDEEEESEKGEARKRGLPDKKKKKLLDQKTWERDAKLVETAKVLQKELGDGLFEDHNIFQERVDAALDQLGLKLGAADKKTIMQTVSRRVETAPPVVAKIHKPGKAKADPLHGRHEATSGGKKCIVEYEPDSELRDSEQVPLLEEGGIEAFVRREVLPYTPDAWIDESANKIGYEVSFNRHFYKPQPLRTLDEIRADILAVQKEAEGLVGDIIGQHTK